MTDDHPARARYRLIDGTGPGRLFIYDEKWGRILVFLKSDGTYLEQWSTSGPLPSMEDVRGMYITQAGSAQVAQAARGHLGDTKGIYRSTAHPGGASDLSATRAPDGALRAERTPKPTKTAG